MVAAWQMLLLQWLREHCIPLRNIVSVPVKAKTLKYKQNEVPRGGKEEQEFIKTASDLWEVMIMGLRQCEEMILFIIFPLIAMC